MSERFLLFFAFLSALAFSQQERPPILISERVGDAIDGYEQCYFHLFSESKFKEARVVQGTDGQDYLQIIYFMGENIQSRAVLLSPNDAADLRFYLDHFENLTKKFYFKLEGLYSKQIISRPPSRINPTINIKSFGTKTLITTTAGDSLKGTLLYAADSLLIVSTNFDCYDWRKVGEDARLISPKNVNQILLMRSGEFGEGFLLGFMVGGVTGALLNAKTEFYGPLPGGIAFGLSSGLVVGILDVFAIPAETLSIEGNQSTFQVFLPKLQGLTYFGEPPAPEIMELIRAGRKRP